MAADSSDKYIQPANGEFAGSYHTDGSWNRGGWSSYPSADELAISSSTRATTITPPDPGR